MKRLLPSLREKKRYIVFETSEADKRKVFNTIESALKDFLGILGMSKINPIIVDFKDKTGIIRINNPYKDEVIVALSLIKTMKIRVIKVSGILKKARV